MIGGEGSPPVGGGGGVTARDDAVQAAAEAVHARDCGCSDFAGKGSDEPDDVYYVRLAEAAVAAAAPILLADAKRVFETLTVTSKAREEQVERLIAEVARWKALVDAKQSWIDGAKVDLAAEEAEVERLQAELRQSVRAIDHYAGALRVATKIRSEERARLAAAIREAADLIDEHAGGMSSDTAIRYRARAEAFRDAARIAETAPEEGQ